MTTASPWDPLADSVEFSAPLDIDAFTATVPRGARVLDLGCGYGRIAMHLQQSGYEVTGYDASPRLIARGRSTYPTLDLRIGSACCIPEASKSFDAVVAVALLTTVPDDQERAAIISEICRLLIAGGRVWGVDFLQQDSTDYLGNGQFISSAGIAMKHFRQSELAADFSSFSGWTCRQATATSLTGKPAAILQYSAQRPLAE